MEAVEIPPVYREIVDHLVRLATPEKILAFQPSEEAQDRASELLDKNSEGPLTPKEQTELDQMLIAHRFISLLKAEALTK